MAPDKRNYKSEGEASKYKTDRRTTVLQDMIQLDSVSPNTFQAFTPGRNSRNHKTRTIYKANQDNNSSSVIQRR